MPAPSLAPPTSAEEDVTRLAHDLRIVCMRISRRVRFEATGQLAPHQFSVLARLAERSHTAGDLAGIERVSAPSMSRTVAGLVSLGLVDRSADTSDGRVVMLSLTAEGLRVLTEERAQRDAWMAARLEGLTARDRQALRRATDLLERVVAQ